LWLSSDWQYRKKITIQGQSGAGTNYQVLLKVGESSGASGYDFHVEGHSANFPNDQNQSGDLRFTKSDGITLLNFWVEKVEGTSPNRVAYCWVKITDNLDNNVDIYCYYGNSNADNVSSITNTFIREISNLKGAWHCDENSGDTIEDSSGNNYDGTKHGATWTDGKFGSALNFDGDDYVDLGDILDDVFAGVDKKFSFSLWIKPSAQMTNNQIIVKNADSACSENQRQFIFRLFNDSKPEFLYYCSLTATDYRGVLGSTPITNLDKWYHLVVTYDGSVDTNDGLDRVKIYVDGQAESTSLDLSGGNLGDIQNGTSHLGFGKHLNSSGGPCGNTGYFNGIMDEIFIFDKVLTAEEISDLYNNYGYTTTNYSGKILVRKRTDPEPNFSASSFEEKLGAVYIDAYLLKTGWLSNWNYRRKITITNNVISNLSDFQVKIELDSSNFDFSKAKNDGSDIRITDDDGTTLLKYWLQKWDSANSKGIIWVKVPLISGNSEKNIYLYYGNSEASDAQEPKNVFLDYSDGNYENEWSENSSNLTVSNENGELKFYATGSGSDRYAEKTFNVSEVKYVVEFRIRVSEYGDHDYFFASGIDGNAFDNKMWQLVHPYSEDQDGSYYQDTSEHLLYSPISMGTYYRYKIIVNEANEIKYYIYDDNDNQLANASTTSFGGSPTDVDNLKFGPITSYSQTQLAYISWIFTRKYVSTEPSLSIGSEESKKTFDYSIDILLKIIKQELCNLDILLQKFDSVNYNIDLIIEEITKKDYNTDILLETVGQESYVLDILLQKLNSISYNIDLILNKIGKSQYSIDLMLQTEEGKSEYNFDVLLKGILNLNYQFDVLLKLLRSLVYSINAILNKLESITYDNDILLEQLQSFNYDIDILLKQLSSSIYDINVLFKQLQILTYNIDIIIKVIGKQIPIDIILLKANEIKHSIDVFLLAQRLRFAPCKLTLDYNRYDLTLDFQCNEFNLDFAC